MYKNILIVTVFSIFVMACDSGPKIISTPVDSPTKAEGSTGIFSSSPPTPGGTNTSASAAVPPSSGLHNVVVKEVLPTEKYVYLNVTEGSEKYWIATGKREVKVGEKYFFNGGLLKTNFESKEYDRIFDKVYLVSNIIPATPSNTAKSSAPTTWPEAKGVVKQKAKTMDREGSMKIADLIADPGKYEGKEIQLTGECAKLNANIMGRNWIHLKDGSKDDYDLVVTSDAAVPEGHVVTVVGQVTLDKDFGAGYRYDIIVENGKIIR